MLVNVACKDSIYRSRRNHREVRTGGPYDSHILSRITPQILFIDIERDFFSRANVVDEVAKPRPKIQCNSVRVDIALQVVTDRAPERILPMDLSLRKTVSINLCVYHEA